MTISLQIDTRLFVLQPVWTPCDHSHSQLPFQEGFCEALELAGYKM